jgi:cell wall-associated NlpC family hydrolase
VWGAAGPSAFDCSGLVVWAYAQAGVSIGRDTYALEGQGTVVPLSQIQPGDMVFYWGGGHVALYVGGGTVIHAPHTGDVVRYASLYMGPPELVVRPT